MNDVEGLKDARDQLAMVLSFFPRVDAKLSTILAVDTAMLAYMSSQVPGTQSVSAWSGALFLLTCALLAVSYLFLYKGAFPDLKGGSDSIVYFRNISTRSETGFIEEYTCGTPTSLRSDVLGQVWRNSEILCSKYGALKVAFITMASAVPLWTSCLVLFALQRSNLKISVSHQ